MSRLPGSYVADPTVDQTTGLIALVSNLLGIIVGRRTAPASKESSTHVREVAAAVARELVEKHEEDSRSQTETLRRLDIAYEVFKRDLNNLTRSMVRLEQKIDGRFDEIPGRVARELRGLPQHNRAHAQAVDPSLLEDSDDSGT